MLIRCDVLVIGAGAAGLMCALTAGQRGRMVQVIDHANKVGKKILMSGGGRCNFTNTGTTPANFLSANPHFCKSALARYTPWHFIEMVERHGIAYHEKELGQLFCDVSSKQIVHMLMDECQAAGVQVRTDCAVHQGRTRRRRFPRARPRRGISMPPRWWWPPAGCPSPAWARAASATSWPASSATRCCRPAPGWCR